MRRTPAAALGGAAGLGLVLGRAIPVLYEQADAIPPTVPWSSAIVLLVLAVILSDRGWATYRTLHRERGRVDPMQAVRLLVLAKASALAGSLVAGAYVGYAAAFVGDLDASLPRERAVHSGAAALAAGLVVVAALFLERACEVPKDDDSDADSPGPPGGVAA